ncbi:MAG: hypothetical protein FGF50_06110 [Candidatus Brockarchaeota archaeon]|nr:hypothetical protein [Candidatus Brockarchaeota archaeon]
MVYALKPEETAGFSKWWARIEGYEIYEEPNFSKALHDARDVSQTTAMVPIEISGAFELYFIVLNLNPDKTLSIVVSASLAWLKPESISLSYSPDSPGLYAGLPLAILGIYFLVWQRRGETLAEHSSHWTRILDSLTFSAILLLPFALYFSTEKDWNNSTVFMFNSYNPINALSPEFIAVFTVTLQSILLHEYGHFAAAKAIGLKAEIMGSKEPNVFAVTRISAGKPWKNRSS